ncbi:MAG: hypothetical protein IJT19_05765 [Bacteroidaceae bacterium]|nr:hypothetical protein [Bacteroidaceae bacterium]
MKKLFTLIALTLLTLSAGAQAPGAIPVEPGSKGPLPETTPLPGFSEPERFGALLVSSTLGSDTWASDRGHYKVGLEWWAPSDFGGEYYTLQYRYGSNSEWQTEKDDNGGDKRYDENSLGTGFESIPGYTIHFRVMMHGGPLTGYLSNEVTATVPSIFTTFGGYGSENEPWYNVVGQKLGGYYNLIVRAWDEKLEKYVEYYKDSNVYKYAWYRVNPTTREETRIEGADQDYYVPTIEDVGYWLYCEISGDGEHCDFVWRYLPCSGNPMVCVPVKASPAYFGPDGFILNTDYILPTPGQDLYTSWYEYNEETQTGQEMSGAVGPRLDVRKSGQYAVRMTEDEYMYNMVLLSPELSAKGYLLTFTYQHGDGYYDEDGNWVDVPWYRECQLMADRYAAPLAVKPVASGRPVPTVVDLIGPDIDGNLVVKQSATWENYPEDEAINFDMVSNLTGVYVKARATASTLDTYYPSALLWGDATFVKPEYDEDWNAPTVTIDVQWTPEPLTGTGTIEGVVADGAVNVKAWAPSVDEDVNSGPSAPTGYSVYLRVKDGDIVAQTSTDESGKYRFENVPFGTYEVLVNIDGCILEQPALVTLSAANPSVSGVNYAVSGTEIVATAIRDIRATSPEGAVHSLDGRRVELPTQHGVYIRNGRKFIVK